MVSEGIIRTAPAALHGGLQTNCEIGTKCEVALLHGFDGLDLDRARALIEASFGRKLAPDYFTMPSSETRVLLLTDYSAIAVIKTIDGADYLDKIAVVPGKKGCGTGKALWAHIQAECPSLIWRANPANKANKWYADNSDGSAEVGGWMVFWYGMDAASAANLVPTVVALPKTILDEPAAPAG
jgi:bifunctional N-acetylglutamate synthase/kinase